MKKTILILIAAISMTFAASAQTQKNYNLEENQVNILFQAFQVAKKALPTSSVISASEASSALMSIDSIAKVFIKQNKEFIRLDSLAAKAKVQGMVSQPDSTFIKPKN